MYKMITLIALMIISSYGFADDYSEVEALFIEKAEEKFEDTKFTFMGTYVGHERENFEHDNEVSVSVKLYTEIDGRFVAKSCTVKLALKRQYGGAGSYEKKSISCRKIKFNAERTFDNGVSVSRATSRARRYAVNHVMNTYDWGWETIHYYNLESFNSDIKKVVDRYTLTKVIYGAEKDKKREKICTLVAEPERDNYFGLEGIEYQMRSIHSLSVISFKCRAIK